MRKAIQELIVTKESQSREIIALNRTVEELKVNRMKEFHFVSSHIQQSIKSEFELMKGKLHIIGPGENSDAKGGKSIKHVCNNGTDE